MRLYDIMIYKPRRISSTPYNTYPTFPRTPTYLPHVPQSPSPRNPKPIPIRSHRPPAPGSRLRPSQSYSNPKLAFSPSPNLLIASSTCSADAAAKVVRKNMSSPLSLPSLPASARNQLPLEESTPRSIAAWKISSSISSMVF